MSNQGEGEKIQIKAEVKVEKLLRAILQWLNNLKELDVLIDIYNLAKLIGEEIKIPTNW